MGSHARIVPSRAVQEYENHVAQIAAIARQQLGCTDILYPMPTFIEVSMLWHRGDRRRCDLDNAAKAIQDGLTTGRIWSDDHQVHVLHMAVIFDASGASQEWMEITINPIT